MIPVVEERLPEIAQLCREHHVARLELFGSAADGRFRPGESDLDFLVAYRPDASAGGWGGPAVSLSAALSDLFGMPVDVIEESNIRNPYLLQGVDVSPKALLYVCPDAPPPPRKPVPHIMPECSLLELRTTKLLHDMHDAGRAIIEKMADKEPADYLRDVWLRWGVERSFEIIGEAAVRLRRHNPATAARISNLGEAIGLRNIITHEYDNIDTAKVWEAIEVTLPVLIQETGELLAEG